MEVSRQISTVLHLKPGTRVIALDDTGLEYEVELEVVAPRTTQGRRLGERRVESEPRTRLSLYVGLTQREKFEWILQKCAEVGASEFVPVVSSRSLVQSVEDTQSKHERWQRILQEAAEQSGRGRIPTLAPALRWEAALRRFQERATPGLIAWEGEKSSGLATEIQRLGIAAAAQPCLAVFIGPEGGYSEQEVAQSRAAGLAPVTLGRRILRMETAAVAATALILHELADL